MRSLLTLFSFLIITIPGVRAQVRDAYPRRVAFGSALPGSCSTGESFQLTSAAPGAQWYLCESGTWKTEGGGGISGAGGTGGQVQYNNSGALGGFTVGGDGQLTPSTGTLVVQGLQTRAVSSAAPSTGNALVWNGTQWGPGSATNGLASTTINNTTLGTVTVTPSSIGTYAITLTGSVFGFSGWSGQVDGQIYTFMWTQGGSGGYTVAYPASMTPAPPQPIPDLNAITTVQCVWVAANSTCVPPGSSATHGMASTASTPGSTPPSGYVFPWYSSATGDLGILDNSGNTHATLKMNQACSAGQAVTGVGATTVGILDCTSISASTTANTVAGAIYCSDASVSPNTITCAPTTAFPGTYSAGQTLIVKVANNSTSTVQINVNGDGLKNVTKNGNTGLSSGDLVAGNVYTMTYDGTEFVAQLGGGGGGGGTFGTLSGGTNTSATMIAGSGSLLETTGNPFTVLLNNVGTVISDGLLLQNTTAAGSSTTPQYPARIHWQGSGWKTNATAGAQTMDTYMYSVYGTDAANPDPMLVFDFYAASSQIASSSFAICGAKSSSMARIILDGGTNVCKSGFGGTGFGSSATSLFNIVINGSDKGNFQSNGLLWSSGSRMMWGSGTSGNNTTGQTGVEQYAAGVVAIDDGSSTACSSSSANCRDLRLRHTLNSGVSVSGSTITGFGTTPSAAGYDGAMVITVGTSPGATGSVSFQTTWTNSPVCTASDQTTILPLSVSTTTTQVTITTTTAFGAGDKISVLCQGY